MPTTNPVADADDIQQQIEDELSRRAASQQADALSDQVNQELASRAASSSSAQRMAAAQGQAQGVASQVSDMLSTVEGPLFAQAAQAIPPGGSYTPQGGIRQGGVTGPPVSDPNAGMGRQGPGTSTPAPAAPSPRSGFLDNLKNDALHILGSTGDTLRAFLTPQGYSDQAKAALQGVDNSSMPDAEAPGMQTPAQRAASAQIGGALAAPIINTVGPNSMIRHGIEAAGAAAGGDTSALPNYLRGVPGGMAHEFYTAPINDTLNILAMTGIVHGGLSAGGAALAEQAGRLGAAADAAEAAGDTARAQAFRTAAGRAQAAGQGLNRAAFVVHRGMTGGPAGDYVRDALAAAGEKIAPGNNISQMLRAGVAFDRAASAHLKARAASLRAQGGPVPASEPPAPSEPAALGATPAPEPQATQEAPQTAQEPPAEAQTTIVPQAVPPSVTPQDVPSVQAPPPVTPEQIAPAVAAAAQTPSPAPVATPPTATPEQAAPTQPPAPATFQTDFEQKQQQEMAALKPTFEQAGWTPDTDPQSRFRLQQQATNNLAHEFDPATGLLGHESLKNTVDRAIEHVQQTGQPVSYVYAQATNPNQARQAADFLAGELAPLGGNVSFYAGEKPGEVGAVASGVPAQALAAALSQAQAQAGGSLTATATPISGGDKVPDVLTRGRNLLAFGGGATAGKEATNGGPVSAAGAANVGEPAGQLRGQGGGALGGQPAPVGRGGAEPAAVGGGDSADAAKLLAAEQEQRGGEASGGQGGRVAEHGERHAGGPVTGSRVTKRGEADTSAASTQAAANPDRVAPRFLVRPNGKLHGRPIYEVYDSHTRTAEAGFSQAEAKRRAAEANANPPEPRVIESLPPERAEAVAERLEQFTDDPDRAVRARAREVLAELRARRQAKEETVGRPEGKPGAAHGLTPSQATQLTDELQKYVDRAMETGGEERHTITLDGGTKFTVAGSEQANQLALNATGKSLTTAAPAMEGGRIELTRIYRDQKQTPSPVNARRTFISDSGAGALGTPNLKSGEKSQVLAKYAEQERPQAAPTAKPAPAAATDGGKAEILAAPEPAALSPAEQARAEINRLLDAQAEARGKNLSALAASKLAVNVPELADRFGLPPQEVNKIRMAEEDKRPRPTPAPRVTVARGGKGAAGAVESEAGINAAPAAETGEYPPGSTLNAGIDPGLGKFAREDVLPAMQKGQEELKRWDDWIKALISPASASPQAGQTARLFREHSAAFFQKLEQAHTALLSYRKVLNRLPPAQRWAFYDDVENGRVPSDPLLAEAGKLLRGMFDADLSDVQALGTGKLSQAIDNYLPHLWKDPKAAAAQYAGFHSKRPLAGQGGFLKKRSYMTLADGMAAGLVPVTDDPIEMALLQHRQIQQYVMAQRVLAGMKQMGLTTYVPAAQRVPDGLAPLEDRIAQVWGGPTITVREAFDEDVMRRLQDLLDTLQVPHERASTMSGGAWGKAQGDKKVTTRFAGPESVVSHELGHVLDARYKIWDYLTQKGLRVPGIPGARKTIAQELKDLADLRYEGKTVGPAYRQYVRQSGEKVANAIMARIYAPEKAAQVAPTVMKRLDRFIKEHPELKALDDIRPSLVLGQRAQEVPVGGLIKRGQYYATPEAARVFNNYLSPGLRGNPLYDGLRYVGNAMNQAQLGISGFHFMFTLGDSITSNAAGGIHRAARGAENVVRGALTGNAPRAAAGARGLASGARDVALSPAAPFMNALRGSRLLREYYRPGSQGQDVAQIVDAYIAGGGRPKMDRHEFNDAIKTFQLQLLSARDAAMTGNPVGAAARLAGAVPKGIMAGLELSMKPLMEHWVPLMKAGAVSSMLNAALDDLPAGKMLSRDELREMAAQAVDSVDNRMGQLNYDNLFWHKTFKEGLMVTVRSVGWNVGTLREIGGALADATPIPTARRLRADDPLVTPRMGYVTALVFGVALAGAIYQYLHTGDGPKDWKDLLFPRTGKLRPDGKPERVSMPNYLSKDVYSYATHPLKTLGDKTNPVIASVIDMLKNQDFYGNEIRNPDDPLTVQARQTADYLAGQFEPFSARNFQQYTGQGPERAAESFLGIMPAPADVDQTAAEKMMRDYLGQDLPGGHTPEEAAQQDERRQIVKSGRAGENIRAKLRAAIGDGDMTARSARQILKNDRLPSDVVMFRHLTAPQAVQVFQAGTPEEKKELAPSLRRKMRGQPQAVRSKAIDALRQMMK